VLCVAALGDSVSNAQRPAYAAVEKIQRANELHRHDMGWRAMARENA
jgi:phosphoribosylamine--glycine ligase